MILVEVYTTVDDFPSLTSAVQLNNFDSIEEFKRLVDIDTILADELRVENAWGQVNVWEGEGDKHQMHRVRLGKDQDWLPVLRTDVEKLYRYEVDKAEERRFVFLANHPEEV